MSRFLLCLVVLLLPLLSAADLPTSALLRHHPHLSSLNELLHRSNLSPELDLPSSLTILVPPESDLVSLLSSHLPPHALADLLRPHILPEYRSLDDLLALARQDTPVPSLSRNPHPGVGSVRFRHGEAGCDGGLSVELPDGSSRLVRKSLLEVPERISVLETSDSLVSRAAAPAKSPAPTPSPAPAPAPVPVNITQVMVAAGEYSTFISLLQSNKVDVMLQSLANQTNGVTVFCPTNKAFASLPSSLLKNISAQQVINLLEYHAMPSFHPLSTFQQTDNSVFNTLATQYNGGYGFTLNVSNDAGIVVFSTGHDNANLFSTLYSTDPAALYAVDHVLLPLAIFGVAGPSPSPSPAPAPSPSSLKSGSGKGSSAGAPAPSASDAARLRALCSFVLAISLCGLLALL